MKLDEILASWENRPEAFTGQKVDTATFIGPNSQAWESGAYQEALEMEKKGVSPKEIWQRTGSGRSIDGKWRQEISDDKATLKDIKKGDFISDLGQQIELSQGNSGIEGGGYNGLPVIKGMSIDSFINDQLGNIGNMAGGTEFALNEGTLGDTLQHDKLKDAYPGIMKSSMTFSPELKPRLMGRHHLNSPKWTDVGLDIANMSTIDEPKNPMRAQRWNDEFVRDRYNPNKSKYNIDDVTQVYDNMSIPNMTLFGTDKGKDVSREDIFDSILHENQHSIQEVEDFGMGHSGTIAKIFQNKQDSGLGKIKDYITEKGVDWDSLTQEDQRRLVYLMQPGEAEARATSRRMNLDDTQRRQNFPFEQTQGILADDFNTAPKDSYGYDVPIDVARDLWRHNNPNMPQAPLVIPGAKAGTPVNRPSRTSVEPEYRDPGIHGEPRPSHVPAPTNSPREPRKEYPQPEPHYAPPFMPTPTNIVDTPVDTGLPPLPEGSNVGPMDEPKYKQPEPHYSPPFMPPEEAITPPALLEPEEHGEGHDPIKPKDGFNWGKLLDGDMDIGQVWDAIPGTDIEDWKKKMPPVGEGVGGFMNEEEMTPEQFNKLMEEMLRNGKIRSNR